MQEKSTYTPTSGALSGVSFEEQTINKFKAQKTWQSGNVLPVGIEDQEIWLHTDESGKQLLGVYRYDASKPTEFGTLMLGAFATNEELSKEDPTEAELVALEKKINNARQFIEFLQANNQEFYSFVESAQTKGQVYDFIKLLDDNTGILSTNNAGLYYCNSWVDGPAEVTTTGFVENLNAGSTSSVAIKKIYRPWDSKDEYVTHYSTDTATWTSWQKINDSSSSAPLPTSSTFLKISGAMATGYTLPAGGTWAYALNYMDSNTRLLNVEAGVAAGGTQVAQSIAGISTVGWIWRIA